MEDKQYYQQGEIPKRRKGPDGFWITVFVLLGIITVLVLYYIISGINFSFDFSVQTPFTTPAPTAGQVEQDSAEEKENQAMATPAPGSVSMPELDGVAPDLTEYADSPMYHNPVPAIYQAVSESVVGVLNYRTQSIADISISDIYGSGTGFVVSSDGYLLTNAHVIEGAERVAVRFVDGSEVPAAVIGFDNETDIAVLKVEAPGLKPVKIGDSDACQVGEFVIAIGNPLNADRLVNTTTLGVISATSRSVTIDSHTNEYLQTDAAINFGNSGGPLLNLKGEVIGMNSAKSVTAGYDHYGNPISAEGIGFALPINHVISIMEHLITQGEIQRPALGIEVRSVTESLAAQLGLSVSEGVYVASVVRDGPAAQAGLKAGDVIVAANGEQVAQKERLIEIVTECDIGDTVLLTVNRLGEELQVEILLGNKGAMDFNDKEQ